MKQSALLRQFYKAYVEWLDLGAPDQIIFRRYFGLCSNLNNWATNNKIYGQDAIDLSREMQSQFRVAGGSVDYPFNRGDADLYTREVDFELAHENEQRNKWVRDHAVQ